MAPIRTTGKKARKAKEPTPTTGPNTSPETSDRGSDNKSQAESPELTKAQKRNISEAKRRDNIRAQYLRMKAIIPSIKDEENVEASPEIMLEAFDREASEQVTRRAMLQQQIAAIQQAINNAGHKGAKNTPLPQGPWIETAANRTNHLPPGSQFNPDTMSNGT